MDAARRADRPRALRAAGRSSLMTNLTEVYRLVSRACRAGLYWRTGLTPDQIEAYLAYQREKTMRRRREAGPAKPPPGPGGHVSRDEFKAVYLRLGTTATARALGVAPASVTKRARRMKLPYSCARNRA